MPIFDTLAGWGLDPVIFHHGRECQESALINNAVTPFLPIKQGSAAEESAGREGSDEEKEAMKKRKR